MRDYKIAKENITKKAKLNERMYPARSHSRYYHLIALRNTIGTIAKKYLSTQGEKILVDFGCGNMPYRSIYEPYVSQYIGIDLPGNELADLFASEDGKTSLSNDFADIVISTQVLEHVDKPAEYIHECHRILKPNGLLILSTHGYWMYHPDPVDFWRWTSSGIRKIIEESGLRVVHLQGIMGLLSTSLQLFQDALIFRIPKLIRIPFVYTMQLMISMADKIDSQKKKDEDASVFVLVCAKE